MILQCSECNARYAVPDKAIGTEGRTVRCAKCKHSWFVAAPAPAEEPAPEMPDFDALLDESDKKTADSQAPEPAYTVPALRPPPPAAMWLKVTTLGMSLVCIVLSLITWQPSWIGYKSTSGIQLKDIKFRQDLSQKRGRYIISGMIANNTDHRVKAPILRVSLLDEHGNNLQYWEFEDDSINIEPGKEIPFNADQLESRFSRGTHLVVDLGNSLELALREMK